MPLVVLLLFWACEKNATEIPNDRILAKIGDRVITGDEFIRRAEYTIRPNYCKMDNYIHRKIILNSLIAEKLLSLEAGKDNQLAENEEFLKYIQGRKEQAMRQYFYNDRAYNTVKLDSNAVKNCFRVAGRTYDIQFLRLPDEKTALAVYHLYTKEQIPFAKIAAEILPDSLVPSRKVSFTSDLNDEMFKMLFSGPLKKNQMLNPVKIDDGSYLVMKVEGWEDERVLNESAIRTRTQNVTEKLRTIQANAIYSRLIADIMKGKSIEFTEETFRGMVEIIGPRYLKNLKEKKDAFNRQFWGQANEVGLDLSLDEKIEDLRDKPFFNLDDETWTVADFEELVKSHPLVFRKRQISKQEFPEQFKLAVVDLIRDHFINQEAYKAGYDKNAYVENYTNMWYDATMSDYQRDQYLLKQGCQAEFQTEYLSIIDKYLNTYIDNLQAKYADIIEINTDLFEQISLTRIDLFVIQSGVPYPIVSPGFPILTTDSKLNYGKKMKVESND